METTYHSSSLELIDQAVRSAKKAAHACQNEQAKEHFEYGLALLRESWIAESGQDARRPEKVITDVQWGLRLIAAVASKAPHGNQS